MIILMTTVERWREKLTVREEGNFYMSCEDSVVISVAAYPEPQQTIRNLNGQCPIMHPYTD
jgi:hypothetical protein